MSNKNYQSIEKSNPDEEIEGNEEIEVEKEESEPKVSTLELFSDLVIVVSIHVVAEPLEEAEFTHYAVVMKSNNCPIYNFVISIWMYGILHMSQNFSLNNDFSAIKWYMFLKLFSIMLYARQVYFPYKAISLPDGSRVMSISGEFADQLQEFVPVLITTFIFCEFIPLALAIRWGVNDKLYYPMVLASMVLIVSAFIVSVISGSRGKPVVNAIDPDHLQERYELISLIFTGELCFAAGKPGNVVGSNAVMCMAFATYLLTFKTHPLKGQIKFWARGVIHTVVGLFLYAGVFCAIPAMGSAFARIISGEEENFEEKEEYISAGDLLCYSAGAFMIFTAMMTFINVDPEGNMKPKISSMKRGAIRISCGLIMLALTFIPEEIQYKGAPLVTVIVPALALYSTTVEIWAVGSLKVAI